MGIQSQSTPSIQPSHPEAISQMQTMVMPGMGPSKQNIRVKLAQEILEMVMVMTILVLIHLFLPVSWTSTHLLFCTFAFFIFATALRRNRITSYIAGVLASGSYLLLLIFFPHHFGFSTEFAMGMEAFLLLLSGILLSDLLQGQRQRQRFLELEQIRLEKLVREANKRYEAVTAINAQLEKRISGQQVSMATISDKLAQLWRLNIEDRHKAVLDIILHTLEAQACSLYREQDRVFQECAQLAQKHIAAPKPLPVDSPFFHQVLQTKGICSIRDLVSHNQAPKEASAVMAGPLLDRQGEVKGIVVINTMPFLKVTPNLVLLFEATLQMVSIALETDASTQESSRKAIHEIGETLPHLRAIPKKV